jgi:hypothetical protein
VVNLKNIVVGFLVSFIGSVPLGYLNVIGFDIYTQKGISATIHYLLGVILIELLVIYLTLIFAKRLADNKKLTQFIEGFSIIFMLVLATVFYVGSSPTNHNRTVFSNIQHFYFLSGILFSGFNFIQIPFWTGWNLWLLNGKHIEISGVRKYGYLLGTIVGTFCGMLSLIVSLYYFSANIDFLSKYLMKIIIPTVFLGLGMFQLFKFFRKYYT